MKKVMPGGVGRWADALSSIARNLKSIAAERERERARNDGLAFSGFIYVLTMA